MTNSKLVIQLNLKSSDCCYKWYSLFFVRIFIHRERHCLVFIFRFDSLQLIFFLPKAQLKFHLKLREGIEFIILNHSQISNYSQTKDK